MSNPPLMQGAENFGDGKYQIVHLLLDLPSCKIFKIIELKGGSPLYLLDYEKESVEEDLGAEIEFWLSVKGYPFPEIVETGEKESRSYLVFQAPGTTSLKQLAETVGFEAEKSLSALQLLSKLIEGMQSRKVAMPQILSLIERIFFSAGNDGAFLAPLPLALAFGRNVMRGDLLKATPVRPDESAYVRLFSSISCFVLTGFLPEGDNLPAQARDRLPAGMANLLQTLLSRKVRKFSDANKLLHREIEARKRALAPPPDAVARSTPFAPIAKRIAAISAVGLKVTEIAVRGVFFLLFLVGSYYWEQTRKVGSDVGRGFRKLRYLRRSNLKTYIEGETALAKQDVTQARLFFSNFFPIPEIDLLQFTRHLGALLKAGVPFTLTLKVLKEQTSNPKLKAAVATLYDEVVNKGRSLSGAMRQTKGAFPELYINMVSAGEITGKVGEVLERAADYIDRSYSLKRKIRAASTYPLIIAVTCFGLFSFFVYVILPKLVEIFKGMQIHEYPLPTRMLIAIVQFAHSPLTLLFVGIGVIVSFFPLVIFLRSILGKARMDELKLNIPMFGRLYKKILLTRFCSTLGTMVRCGVPLLNSFEVTGRATGNEFFNGIVEHIIEEIRQGGALFEILSKSGFFPPLVVSMVQVGETAGSLEAMLIKISEIYDGEVAYLLQQFVSMIEPILMAMMGIVVGFVVLAVFMPIYAIIGGIR